ALLPAEVRVEARHPRHGERAEVHLVVGGGHRTAHAVAAGEAGELVAVDPHRGRRLVRSTDRRQIVQLEQPPVRAGEWGGRAANRYLWARAGGEQEERECDSDGHAHGDRTPCIWHADLQARYDVAGEPRENDAT